MKNLDLFKLSKNQMMVISGGREINAHCTLSKDGIDTVIDIYTTITDESKLQKFISNSRPEYKVSNCIIN